VPLLGCNAPDSPQDAVDSGHAEVHWGYEGEAGPDHWAELSPEFSECASGREQSPIDLTDATLVVAEQFDRLVGEVVVDAGKRSTILDLIDNGHTSQVTPNADIGVEIEGHRFGLAQYHFHSPSEHAIDGKRYPLEAHFVTSDAEGELAVFGILYVEGEHAPEFEAVIANLPNDEDDARHLENLELKVDELRPLPEEFYSYRGSLTTPPCSEGVRWFVMAEVETLSADQLEALVSRLHENARPLQPLAERELLKATVER